MLPKAAPRRSPRTAVAGWGNWGPQPATQPRRGWGGGPQPRLARRSEAALPPYRAPQIPICTLGRGVMVGGYWGATRGEGASEGGPCHTVCPTTRKPLPLWTPYHPGRRGRGAKLPAPPAVGIGTPRSSKSPPTHTLTRPEISRPGGSSARNRHYFFAPLAPWAYSNGSHSQPQPF